MHTEKIQLSDIRYNPQNSAFEALVRVHDNGEVLAYPAHVCAPLNAEHEVITHGLVECAMKTHNAPAPGLRLRRTTATPTRHAPKFRATPLMRRILKALAA